MRSRRKLRSAVRVLASTPDHSRISESHAVKTMMKSSRLASCLKYPPRPSAIHCSTISIVKTIVNVMSMAKNAVAAFEPSAGNVGVSIASMIEDHRIANRMKLVKYVFSTIFTHSEPMYPQGPAAPVASDSIGFPSSSTRRAGLERPPEFFSSNSAAPMPPSSEPSPPANSESLRDPLAELVFCTEFAPSTGPTMMRFIVICLNFSRRRSASTPPILKFFLMRLSRSFAFASCSCVIVTSIGSEPSASSASVSKSMSYNHCRTHATSCCVLCSWSFCRSSMRDRCWTRSSGGTSSD